ncbi:MAG TPA: Asp-tRNA(Asn)/Glu-tRNA(Gln) amidotransferase subunit GatC, partial [Actinomycetota bacterium]|nr:Asp-tRNA(Asn)/Glu-tRNA(Gln) amidotransferase subunit GatC [Actinomycetota bacterium]
MTVSRSDVEHVARLARLALSDEEVDRFGEQLSKILDHAEKVTSLDTDGVEPTSHPVRLVNVLRPDEPVPGVTAKEALANAPH